MPAQQVSRLHTGWRSAWIACVAVTHVALAHRFNVSLPDDLVERLEPFKADLSLSQVLQQALEAQIRECLRSTGDQERARALSAAAKNYWIQKRRVLHYTVEAFVENLITEALNDNDYYVFDLYRRLQNESHDKVFMEIFDDEAVEEPEDEYENPKSQYLLARLIGFLRRFAEKDELIGQCYAGIGDFDELKSLHPDEEAWDGDDFAHVIRDILSARLAAYIGSENISHYLA